MTVKTEGSRLVGSKSSFKILFLLSVFEGRIHFDHENRGINPPTSPERRACGSSQQFNNSQQPATANPLLQFLQSTNAICVSSQLPACQDSRIRCCSLPIGPGFALQLPLASWPASSQLARKLMHIRSSIHPVLERSAAEAVACKYRQSHTIHHGKVPPLINTVG